MAVRLSDDLLSSLTPATSFWQVAPFSWDKDPINTMAYDSIVLLALVRELEMLFGASFFPLGMLPLLFFQPFGMIMVARHVCLSTIMRAPLHSGTHNWVLRGLLNRQQ